LGQLRSVGSVVTAGQLGESPVGIDFPRVISLDFAPVTDRPFARPDCPLKKTAQARAGAGRGRRRRPQGRPEGGKDSVGKESLIRAARELLEVLPPAKVTRAAVARHAKVDPNLIRYYFQDRDSLLLAVIEHIVSEGRHPEIEEEQQRLPAAEQLRKRVRGFLEFNATYPFFHRLMLDEVVHWKSARARQTFHGLNTGAIAGFAEILKAGVKDRSLRRVDPVLLHIAVIGMSEFFLSSRPLLEDALGKGSTPADFAQRYADMIVDLVSDGIRTR